MIETRRTEYIGLLKNKGCGFVEVECWGRHLRLRERDSVAEFLRKLQNEELYDL